MPRAAPSARGSEPPVKLSASTRISCACPMPRVARASGQRVAAVTRLMIQVRIPLAKARLVADFAPDVLAREGDEGCVGKGLVTAAEGSPRHQATPRTLVL